jgi:hypothetical protein
MPEPVPTNTTTATPSVSSLVAGIVDDARKLIRQELTLARAEIQEDWNDIKTATTSLGAGAVVTFIGGLLLCHMLVYLLYWLVPDLALWGAYLIVGGLMTLGGVVLLFLGGKKMSKIQLGPERTIESLKEIV